MDMSQLMLALQNADDTKLKEISQMLGQYGSADEVMAQKPEGIQAKPMTGQGGVGMGAPSAPPPPPPPIGGLGAGPLPAPYGVEPNMAKAGMAGGGGGGLGGAIDPSIMAGAVKPSMPPPMSPPSVNVPMGIGQGSQVQGQQLPMGIPPHLIPMLGQLIGGQNG